MFSTPAPGASLRLILQQERRRAGYGAISSCSAAIQLSRPRCASARLNVCCRCSPRRPAYCRRLNRGRVGEMVESDITSVADLAKEETFHDAPGFFAVLGSNRFRLSRWVFRGQQDAAWGLQPTLERFAVRMAQPR